MTDHPLARRKNSAELGHREGALHREEDLVICIHTHTLACGHFCWYSLLAITPALLQTTCRLPPSPPCSDGSKGCFKETLLSKIFYEDRFLCISNQSSKSRDQLRHPFVVLHPSPCPGSKKTKQKNILQLERGWGRQESEELDKPTHASKRSSRIKSFLQSESTSMLSTREAGVAPRM